MVKHSDSGVGQIRVSVSAVSLTVWVSFGQVTVFSVPQFPHL